jgi:hypothetical protein
MGNWSIRNWAVSLTLLVVLLLTWKYSSQQKTELTSADPEIPTAQTSQKRETQGAASVQAQAVQNSLSPQETAQLRAYEEIRDSKNDNDPRIDQDLRHLSPAVHQALIKDYTQMQPEKRSERGLVVFLIARDANTLEDLQFLTSVYEEPPCVSLENCSKPQKSDPHLGGIEETTLTYPQTAGLFQLQRKLESADGASLLKDESKKAQLEKLLSAAEQFQSPAIQGRAENLRSSVGL